MYLLIYMYVIYYIFNVFQEILMTFLRLWPVPNFQLWLHQWHCAVKSSIKIFCEPSIRKENFISICICTCQWKYSSHYGQLSIHPIWVLLASLGDAHRTLTHLTFQLLHRISPHTQNTITIHSNDTLKKVDQRAPNFFPLPELISNPFSLSQDNTLASSSDRILLAHIITMPFTKYRRNGQQQGRHRRDDKCDDVVPMGSFDFDHNVDKEKIARYGLFQS